MILITDAFPTIYFVHFLCITGGPLTQQGPHTLFHYPFSNSPSKETWDETPPVGRGAYCLFDNGAHRLCLKNIPGLNFGEKKLWGCFFLKRSNSTECGLFVKGNVRKIDNLATIIALETSPERQRTSVTFAF